MSTFIDRLKQETSELADKYEKLVAFTRSDKFLEVKASDQIDLLEQREVMREYLKILKRRLAALAS